MTDKTEESHHAFAAYLGLPAGSVEIANMRVDDAAKFFGVTIQPHERPGQVEAVLENFARLRSLPPAEIETLLADTNARIMFRNDTGLE
jgi:hypothetical protein